MRRSRIFQALALAALAAMACTPAGAQRRDDDDDRRRGDRDEYRERDRDRDRDRRRGGWELLGWRAIGFSRDRDIVEVGRKAGRVEKIRLRARGNDIFVDRLRVVFGNRETQTIDVRQRLREGDETRPFALEGRRDRFIERIEIEARSRPSLRQRAVLEIYGETEGKERPEARWEEIGCSRVGFLVDRDVIRVGREEGRFRALKLKVEENDIYLQDMRLVFGNGEVDDYRVGAEIRRGQETRPISLRGGRRGRVLDRIIFLYRAKPSFRGAARLCIYGRETE